jgi:predicted transcriptional regulator
LFRAGGGDAGCGDDRPRIRREHLVKGKSIKEIARDLKISRNTVRKILRSGETSFSYEREVQPLPRLGRWKADLDRLLTANAGTSVRERLTRAPSGSRNKNVAFPVRLVAASRH